MSEVIENNDLRQQVTVTLDFDRMMRNVLEKHWGWFGNRPECFEEYVCMQISEHLCDHMRSNVLNRQSEIMEAAKRWMDDEGRKVAERAGLSAEKASWQWGGGRGEPEADSAVYFNKRVEFHIEVLAEREARRIMDERSDED